MSRARNEQKNLESVLDSQSPSSLKNASSIEDASLIEDSAVLLAKQKEKGKEEGKEKTLFSTRRLSRTARRHNLKTSQSQSDLYFNLGKRSSTEQRAQKKSAVEQSTAGQSAAKQPAAREETMEHEPIFSLTLDRLSVEDRFGREELYEEDEAENDSLKIGGAFETDAPFEMEALFQKTGPDQNRTVDPFNGRRWYTDLDLEEKKTLEVTSFGQGDAPSLWQGMVEMFRESSLHKKLQTSRVLWLSVMVIGLSVFAAVLNVGLSGCTRSFQLTNQTFVMELGTDVYANPSLYIENADQVDLSNLSIEPRSPGITIADNRFITVSLDYLGVGSYDFVLKDGDAETPFVIKVKDTKPPTLKNSVEAIEIGWGQKVDWNEVFGATDLSGVYYEPSLDFETTVGEHTVEVKIRDRFGNAVVKTVKVTVIQ
ncbi:hypothetical protein [Allobaculum sp. JKK-2023]|uniref:hypothetical protein n=1 Tax=Allobaculum sp. JKK-2023 TaxID=3108943 RepID=UPI002B0561B1|nr:hypothetical protein [Allobaculum sp. JKK-2023]